MTVAEPPSTCALLQASAEITAQLLSLDGESPLNLITRRLRSLARVDLVTLLLPSADGRRLLIEVASGADAEALRGSGLAVAGSTAGSAFAQGQVLIVDGVGPEAIGDELPQPRTFATMMAVPISAAVGVRGVLCLFREPEQGRFQADDVQLAKAFAGHAAVGLELTAARVDQRRMRLLDDRERSARQLHDAVIQRLFASGMAVQTVVGGLGPGAASVRLQRASNEIDDTMRQLRRLILEGGAPLNTSTSIASRRLTDVVASFDELLGFAAEVEIVGPLDSMLAGGADEGIVELLVELIRETMLNVAEHAHATAARIRIEATPTRLTVDICDNGSGLGGARPSRGLSRLARMAEEHGGQLRIGPPERDDEGAHLTWTIPLS
ncbi:Histidine kinase [Frankineae bacterium MT45]|nr:Histidine kinase [Frankineae bacterium MT45]